MKQIKKYPKIIFIIGPTASGKTDVALRLAELIKASGNIDFTTEASSAINPINDVEVISADSRQIYKFMDIGTAKPSPEELASVKHHFIDIVRPNEYFSAGLFGDKAAKLINKLIHKNTLPIVVGGSGLYIKSLAEGFFNEGITDLRTKENVRKNLDSRLIEFGIETLYNDLMKIDPVAARLYNDMNPRRVIRALEHYTLTGKPISLSWAKTKSIRKFKPLYFGIYWQRERLYERINSRTELMWQNGLVDETEKLLKMGFASDLNALNTVGYKETIAYLKGEISQNQSIEDIKKHTRNYAKRQLTWFKSYENLIWLDGSPIDIANQVWSKYKLFYI